MRIRRYFHWSHTLAVASLVVAAVSAVVPANDSATVNGGVENFDDIVNKQLEAEYAAGDRHLLSRKRRYLIFPEGSSFQVVWDGIVGVVDYTNYLVLGITLALAWELPSKTPSELAEDLQTRLQDGTLGTLRRTDNSTNIKYADAMDKQTKQSYQGAKPGFTPNYIKLSTPQRYQLQPMFHSPMHQKYYTKPLADAYYRRGPPAAVPWRRKDNYYYKATPSSPFTKWSQQRPQMSNNVGQYPWWNLASRISNSWRRPQASPPNQSRIHYHQNKPASAQATRSPGATARHHRIYPIFGKRSVPEQMPPSGEDTSEGRGHRQKRHGIPHHDELSKLERIHIRHHRRTRHVLYGKIESYMDKFGHNGHHCVLRALCETGQKSAEPEPGSFVGELMRVVFTMPEPEPEDAARLLHKEQRYDAANAYREDCAARYHHCKHSMWESPFVM